MTTQPRTPNPENPEFQQFLANINLWYTEDTKGFQTYFDAAVENVKPIPEEILEDDPDGTYTYDWRNKTIDDLCQFFTDWYVWEPLVPTGLDYIQKFSWLYYQNEYGLAFVTKGNGYQMTADFVEVRGKYFDSTDSQELIKTWVNDLGGATAVCSEFYCPNQEDPYLGFDNFNQFFARNLNPEANPRPITSPDDDSVVVAPADSVINMIVNDLTLETKISVKTVYLNVVELLNNSSFAQNFDGGTAVSCILMPDTYHHYHAPVSGTVVESNEDVAGEYFGIDNFPGLLNDDNVGYGYSYSVFEHFRRGYLVIETANYGHVAMIPVGLNTIASVIFEDRFKNVTSENPVAITKGEKIGYFQYGGSLNILLFEKDRFPSLNILQGQQIGFLLGEAEADVKLTKTRKSRFLNRIAYLAR
ncbi:MAG: phosphatidylserine decarboxylase [Moorea sp. SIO3G5]|nr:phosphatidylserine decarboxylase [Moorena sp. SIO3G5]